MYFHPTHKAWWVLNFLNTFCLIFSVLEAAEALVYFWLLQATEVDRDTINLRAQADGFGCFVLPDEK